MPTVHPNYIKASNLSLLLLIIGLTNFLLVVAPQLSVGRGILVLAMMITLTGGMAYLLRKGIEWVKYVFLAIMILSHINRAEWASMLNGGIVRILSFIVVTGLSVWILWLLFTIPNQPIANKKGPDFSEPL